jgi:hypothetical protein
MLKSEPEAGMWRGNELAGFEILPDCLRCFGHTQVLRGTSSYFLQCRCLNIFANYEQLPCETDLIKFHKQNL